MDLTLIYAIFTTDFSFINHYDLDIDTREFLDIKNTLMDELISFFAFFYLILLFLFAPFAFGKFVLSAFKI